MNCTPLSLASAGVGRSGTFIALDQILKKIPRADNVAYMPRSPEYVDIFNIVYKVANLAYKNDKFIINFFENVIFQVDFTYFLIPI